LKILQLVRQRHPDWTLNLFEEKQSHHKLWCEP